jgi:phytoene/squalene synthetase
MNTPEFRQRLARLSTSQIKALAVAACVSERGLWRIRAGETKTVSESVKLRVIEVGFPRVIRRK